MTATSRWAGASWATGRLGRGEKAVGYLVLPLLGCGFGSEAQHRNPIL